MNPMIDLALWAVVVTCCVALWFEVPRAIREQKKILAEARVDNRDVWYNRIIRKEEIND
jgi:hypothetical protein